MMLKIKRSQRTGGVFANKALFALDSRVVRYQSSVGACTLY